MARSEVSMEEDLSILDLSLQSLEVSYSSVDKSLEKSNQNEYFNQLNIIYQRVLKDSYKKKIFENHPDRSKNPNSTEICSRINAAYNRLVNVVLRPRQQPAMNVVFPSFDGFQTGTTTTVFSGCHGSGFTIIINGVEIKY